MAKNSDLHTHSCYSDGQLSPKELVSLARKRGIKNLALTDHNTVKGVEEALEEGRKIGVNVIPAVEMETDAGELLGYFIDYKDKNLIKAVEDYNKRNEERVKDWCKKLCKEGYDISFEEVKRKFPKAKGRVNSFYPLYLLYLKGYGKPLKLAPKLKKNKNLKQRKIRKIPVAKAIKLIRRAKGVPVLAHPWLENMESNLKNMKKLVKAGLKGLELNNGDRAPLRSKEAVRRMRNIAKKYDLVLTSGSDYHGEDLVKLMPGDHGLGHNNCDEKVVEKLKSS